MVLMITEKKAMLFLGRDWIKKGNRRVRVNSDMWKRLTGK